MKPIDLSSAVTYIVALLIQFGYYAVPAEQIVQDVIMINMLIYLRIHGANHNVFVMNLIIIYLLIENTLKLEHKIVELAYIAFFKQNFSSKMLYVTNAHKRM